MLLGFRGDDWYCTQTNETQSLPLRFSSGPAKTSDEGHICMCVYIYIIYIYNVILVEIHHSLKRGACGLHLVLPLTRRRQLLVDPTG